MTNKETIKLLNINKQLIDCRTEPIKECNAFNEFFFEVGLNLNKIFNTEIMDVGTRAYW